MFYLLFQVNNLPDLTLTKYSVFEGSGVEDVQDKHGVFLRQLHQLGHRFGVFFHLLYIYNPDKNIAKGNHLQIILYATADTAEKLNGVKEFIETSALSVYYNFFCYDIARKLYVKKTSESGRRYVELIGLDNEIKRFWISENAPSLAKEDLSKDDEILTFGCGAFLTKKDYNLPALNRLETDNLGDVSLYSILEWEPCENGRLYNVLKLMEGYNTSAYIRVDLFPKEHTQAIRQALPYAETRRRVADHKQGKDDNSELIIKSWDNYITNMMKFPQFFVNVVTFSDSSDIAIMLADSIGAEAVESGTYRIDVITSKDVDVFYHDSEILFNESRFEHEKDNYILPFLSLYTLEEVRPMFSLPILYPGETVECKKETDPTFEENGILLGTSDLGYDVKFPIDLFKKHAFIAGVPGAGKTNTMLYLITSLWRDSGRRIPFLVLEPAKQEYRAVARIQGMEEVIIFSPGADTKFPLHINPFEFPIGLTLAEHIANLNAVFAGAFELPPPSPHFIDTCIEKVYLDKGWNVNARNDGTRDYPTLQDLYTSLEVAVKESHYQGETLGNLQSVLEVRVGSLLKREIGNVYNVKNSVIKPEEWLDKPVIIELEALGEGPANFMSLLISTLIREVLKVKKTSDVGRKYKDKREIEHVIFYEEAHNLIGPETEDPVGGSVNPKISATKFLVKMLAEVRALGEGIVIADQLPTVMAPEVLKNTGLKIAHRITAQDDRNLLGGTMSASPVQLEEQGNFGVGQALVFYEKLQKPFKMQMCEWEKGGAKDRYDSPTNNQLFEYIKDRKCYRNVLKESMQIIQKKMQVEFDVLRQNARDVAKKIASAKECKIFSPIDRLHELEIEGELCSELRKVCRSFVNLYYAYMTLSTNYYVHATDMYVCTINNFLSLFEILDLIKNVTLNRILLNETKDVIKEIRLLYVCVQNTKIKGILSKHEGSLHICLCMQIVIANEMQKEENLLLEKCKRLLSEDKQNGDENNKEINLLCNEMEEYFDKYIVIADNYDEMREQLIMDVSADMEKENNKQNIEYMKELVCEKDLCIRKRSQLHIEVLRNIMECFRMVGFNNTDANRLYYVRTQLLRNAIKRYVDYSPNAKETRLSSSKEYGELLELSIYPCAIEIHHRYKNICKQLNEVLIEKVDIKHKQEKIYELCRDCNSLFWSFYVDKPSKFGKNGIPYVVHLANMYTSFIGIIKNLNSKTLDIHRCKKELGKSLKKVSDIIICVEEKEDIVSKETKDTVLFYNSIHN